ncbi:MAG: substrate-binding domain-containing protein [bacterium]|nr:substrate-binding domain-containing protein [Candidatus Sumerlaeota bacterium]
MGQSRTKTAKTRADAAGRDTVLCLLDAGLDRPIERRIYEGLEGALRARGYKPHFGVIPIDPRAEVNRLLDTLGSSVAAIAIQPVRPNRELAETLLTAPVKNIPHIIIGHYYDDLMINACVVDNFGGMYAATEHLILAGRQRLAYVGEVSLSSTENERFQGFCMACLQHGIRVPHEFIVPSYFESDLRVRMRSLFSDPEPPDGIVCLFDTAGMRVLKVLKQLDIGVPDRVAVISMGDDEDLAETLCDPPLSTAYHPAVEMGKAAATRLADLIEARIPQTPSIMVVPVAMHIRASSGSPPHLLPNGKDFWPVPLSGYVGMPVPASIVRP